MGLIIFHLNSNSLVSTGRSTSQRYQMSSCVRTSKLLQHRAPVRSLLAPARGRRHGWRLEEPRAGRRGGGRRHVHHDRRQDVRRSQARPPVHEGVEVELVHHVGRRLDGNVKAAQAVRPVANEETGRTFRLLSNSYCCRHRNSLLLLHCLSVCQVPHCALLQLWFCFHEHPWLGRCDRLHIKGALGGDPAAHGLVRLQDELQLVLLLLQLLDLLLQGFLLTLPQVDLVLQALRLVDSPLAASRRRQLVPLPPHLPPLLLLRAEGLLLLISGFPPSTPVHLLLFLLVAGLQQLKAGGWGGARCPHCGPPALLPVRRVHVDVRLVLQRWWCETCLVLVRLWLLHVHEHLLDCLQGCRRERVCRVGWLQCDVTAEVLFTDNLDPSCHLLSSLRRSLLLPLTSLT